MHQCQAKNHRNARWRHMIVAARRDRDAFDNVLVTEYCRTELADGKPFHTATNCCSFLFIGTIPSLRP